VSHFPPGSGQPYYGQPYPGAYPYPGAPVPPRRGGSTALIVVVALVAVAVLTGAGVVGFLLLRDSGEPGSRTAAGANPGTGTGAGKGADSPRAAVTAFLEDTRSGNYAAAYAKLCEENRKKQSFEQFSQEGDDRRVTSFEVGTQEINARPGRSTAKVNVRLTFNDGYTDSAYIEALDIGDGWRVCKDVT
jgi:hypothetical protein